MVYRTRIKYTPAQKADIWDQSRERKKITMNIDKNKKVLLVVALALYLLYKIMGG